MTFPSHRLGVFLAMVMVLAAGDAALAQFWPKPNRHDDGFWHSVATDAKRMNGWPRPFEYPDRVSVRAPFAAMVDNAWQARATLGDYHFDEETHALNHAGRLKVMWIVTHTPPEYRHVYVLQGFTEKQTNARLMATNEALAGILPPQAIPQVTVTGIEPPTRSGAYIEAVDRNAIRAIPLPILPESGGGGEGGE